MFRKLLFLIILAGIGFGIYTGINKVVEMMNTPKATVVSTTVSTISTGTQTITWTVKKPDNVKTGSVITTVTTGTTVSKIVTVKTGSQTTGFFLGVWTTIKTWFTNLTASTNTPIVVTTGSVTTGTIISTWTISSGDALSGFFDDTNTTGTIVQAESTGTQEITWTTVKKPTTKKTTTHTSNSDRDPVLDALF